MQLSAMSIDRWIIKLGHQLTMVKYNNVDR